MMTNNSELREMMDRDYNNLQLAKSKRFTERDNTYKYGNDNNQEVVKTDIPEWARKALSNPKPGDVVGQYSQNDLRNKRNNE